MNLILIQPEEEQSDGRIILTDQRAKHIQGVLKTTPGSTVRIGLLNGPLGEGVVESFENDSVVLKSRFEKDAPRPPSIDLILAMPRPKVMKRLWAQLAALGVGRIVLLRAEKVERYYFDSHAVDPACYEKLLIEGLQQARCTYMPEVLIRPLFKPFIENELENLFSDHTKIIADPSAQQRLDEIFEPSGFNGRVVLAIGPEGGWTSYELRLLKDGGFCSFSFGQRILRSDTATIALISMLADRMERR